MRRGDLSLLACRCCSFFAAAVASSLAESKGAGACSEEAKGDDKDPDKVYGSVATAGGVEYPAGLPVGVTPAGMC